MPRRKINPEQISLFDPLPRIVYSVTQAEQWDFVDKVVGVFNWDVWTALVVDHDLDALLGALADLSAWSRSEDTPKPLRTRIAWVMARALVVARTWDPAVADRLEAMPIPKRDAQWVEAFVERSGGEVSRVEQAGSSWVRKRPPLRYRRNQRSFIQVLMVQAAKARRPQRRATPATAPARERQGRELVSSNRG